MHQFVHNECRTGHIARILHERDEGIENQNLGQEHDDGSHTANDAVN